MALVYKSLLNALTRLKWHGRVRAASRIEYSFSFAQRTHMKCGVRFLASAEMQTPCNDVLDALQQMLARKARLASDLEDSSMRERIDAFRELSLKLSRGYQELPPHLDGENSPRADIIQHLAYHCSPSDSAVAAAVERYQKCRLEKDYGLTSHPFSQLRRACTPLYEQVFHSVLEQSAKDGMSFIVAFREDLKQFLRLQTTSSEDKWQLRQLDLYLRKLLETWFSHGMLEIRRITYEGTSAAIIEKIAVKESVHRITNLDDLRNRLGPSRRVFALFHPLLPDEPLVFVHVSLQSEIPAGMTQVLLTSPSVNKVAAFYSISNAIPGLVGVGLGEYLIKAVKELLSKELVGLETYVTLSPLPKFRSWLEAKLTHDDWASDDLIPGYVASVLKCTQEEALGRLRGLQPTDLDQQAATLKPLFLQLGARYLVLEKYRDKPYDPVARFHLGNGAEMYRLNFMADMSLSGWRNSFGLMVNYRYTDDVDKNQVQFELNHSFPVQEGVKQYLHPWVDE